jgi:hypothetical protein
MIATAGIARRQTAQPSARAWVRIAFAMFAVGWGANQFSFTDLAGNPAPARMYADARDALALHRLLDNISGTPTTGLT